MTKYKVKDILNLANKKYTLYFDKDTYETQVNTYTRRIRKALKEHGYKKPFNNIEEADAFYLIDHELKNYFIDNSAIPDILKRDEKKAAEAEDQEMRIINQFKNNEPEGYNDAPSQKSLDEVLDSIKDTDYDPISKLKAICNSEDTELGGQIDYLEKKLNELKQNYIFHALLQLNNERFNQVQFIKDYFERNNYIDDRSMIYKPKYGYSKYDIKLKDPINSYIEKNK